MTKRRVYRSLNPEGMIIGPPQRSKKKALELAISIWRYRGISPSEIKSRPESELVCVEFRKAEAQQ
jgi:hypothetical protein